MVDFTGNSWTDNTTPGISAANLEKYDSALLGLSNLSAISITGGTINGTQIGGTTQSAGAFTSVAIGLGAPVGGGVVAHAHSGGNTYFKATNTTSGSTATDGFLFGIASGGEAQLWNYEASGINLATSNASRMYIASNGKVGIGTISPNNIFHIAGTTGTTYQQFTNTATGHTAGDGFIVGMLNSGSVLIYNYENQPISFYTNSTHILELAANGSVGINTASPNASAVLDLTSTTKGLLLPRMTTTQRNAIVSPVAGLAIYNSTTNKLNFHNGSIWEAVTSA